MSTRDNISEHEERTLTAFDFDAGFAAVLDAGLADLDAGLAAAFLALGAAALFLAAA